MKSIVFAAIVLAMLALAGAADAGDCPCCRQPAQARPVFCPCDQGGPCPCPAGQCPCQNCQPQPAVAVQFAILTRQYQYQPHLYARPLPRAVYVVPAGGCPGGHCPRR